MWNFGLTGSTHVLRIFFKNKTFLRKRQLHLRGWATGSNLAKTQRVFFFFGTKLFSLQEKNSRRVQIQLSFTKKKQNKIMVMLTSTKRGNRKYFYKNTKRFVRKTSSKKSFPIWRKKWERVLWLVQLETLPFCPKKLNRGQKYLPQW